jgi:hypothetical protein
MSKKESNPKESLGIRKVPLHTIPVKPLLELGLAMMEGGRKYGTHNYREAGVRYSTYYDAAMRHLTAWWEGEDIDPDSGLPHVVKAMACMLVLRDSQHMGNGIDDRPTRYPDGISMPEFNKKASDIIDKCPERVEPFTHVKHEVVDTPEPQPFDISQLKVGDTLILKLNQNHAPEGVNAYNNGEEFTFVEPDELNDCWAKSKTHNIWLSLEKSEIVGVKHVD